MSETPTKSRRSSGAKTDQGIDKEDLKAAAALDGRTVAFQSLTNYWLAMTGRSSACRRTLAIVFAYVFEAGEANVANWIAIASARCWNDRKMGMYVSGCMRQHRLQQMETEEPGEA